jgi:dsDNA-specific endonuclease/ATPase MutS2
MDSDIEKTKKLLEEGYFILSIQEKYLKKYSQNITEITVKLKKGNDIQVIKACNSSEFFDYIGNFEKCKDKFDNPEFVFVEKSKKQIKRISNFLKNYHFLKIHIY